MWLTNPIIVQHDAWSAKDNKIVSKYRMVQDLRKVNEKLVKMILARITAWERAR